MRHSLAFAVLAVLAVLPRHADAASGGQAMTVTHTGFLLDENDVPVTNAALLATFRVFDRSATVAGETKEWEANCQVNVQAGLYVAVLGGDGCVGDGLDTSDVPVSSPRWLEIAISGVALTPRLALNAVPLAVVARTALDSDLLGGRPASDFAEAQHQHTASEISDFGAAITALTTSGTLAAADHSHGLASATTSGFLSASDWSTFNGKLSTESDPKVGALQAGKWCATDGSRVICTNDPPAGTVGLTSGTYTNATITIDAQGRISAVATGVPSPIEFTLPPQTGVLPGSVVQSAIVLLTGFNVSIPISVSGGGAPAYRICADATCSASPAFTTGAGTVANNSYVQLRVTSPAGDLATQTTTLTTGALSTSWTVTTSDATPDAFSFPNVTNAAVSAVITSDPVTVTGFTGTLTATATGGATVSKDGTTFASSVAGVTPGTAIRVRLTSSASTTTAVTATVTLGQTTSGVWSVTTGATPAIVTCKTLKDAGTNTSGSYMLNVGSGPFAAWCDMTRDGGGWTRVIGIDTTTRNHAQTGAVNPDFGASEFAYGKFSDAVINAIRLANPGTRIFRWVTIGNYVGSGPVIYTNTTNTPWNSAGTYIYGSAAVHCTSTNLSTCYPDNQVYSGPIDLWCKGTGVANEWHRLDGSGYSSNKGCGNMAGSIFVYSASCDDQDNFPCYGHAWVR